MRKSIAILTAAVMTFCLAAPAFAAEDTITTKRNGEEIVLTAAEDTDKTKEEVEAMAKEAADKMDTYTFSMVMNMDVNMSAKTEMGDMSIDMVMNIDALDNKNVDKEYKIQKTTGEMFGTEMNSEEEEYIFKNSSGKKVSVKKTTDPTSDDSDNGKWTVEEAEADNDDDDDSDEPIVEDIAEDVAEDAAEGDSEAEAAEDVADDLEEEVDSANTLSNVASDEMFDSFQLLDKMYTDGTNKYYVFKGKAGEILNSGFSDVAGSLGEIESDKDCYMLLREDGRIDSLDMDLGGLAPQIDEENNVTTTISKLNISLTVDEPTDFEVPAEVLEIAETI